MQQTGPTPSPEALRLAERLQDAPPRTIDVETIRGDLENDFRPRSRRAIDRYSPNISHRTIGGVRCMAVAPDDLVSEAVVLYFFGGGYVSGGPDYELPAAAHLADACRMEIVLPYYPLAPENPYPAAVDAGLSVYRGLSSERVVLAGESAGGGLALEVASQSGSHGLPDPLGACLFSPWVDLGDAGHRSAESQDDPTISVSHLRFCADAYGAPQDSPRPRALPRTFISSGTRDIMLPMLESFAGAEGDRVDLRVWPGLWHVFELYDELPEASLALDQAAEFIKSAADA